MKIVRSTILVAAAAMVSLAPTAAHADTYVSSDSTHDVVKLTQTSQTVEPTRTEGDITRTGVRHGAKRIVLTMRFAELSAVGLGDLHIFGVRSNRLSREVTVDTGPGHWGGKVEVRKPNGKKVSCSVRRSIDYSLNTATVSIPRSCLGNPRWVKVAMQHGTFVSQDDIHVDDARTNGRIFNYMVYGPRVYR